MCSDTIRSGTNMLKTPGGADMLRHPEWQLQASRVQWTLLSLEGWWGRWSQRLGG